MDTNTPQLPPLQAPKPPQENSWKMFLIIFVAAFGVILILLNLPSIASSIAYPFTHSTQSDNEKLTQQYRDIYGYQNHPELIQAVEANSVFKPSPSIYPITVPQNMQIELSIPKIGITAPVLQVNSNSDAVILNSLKDGVVLYPGSVTPGQPGTAVIVGHSSSTPPWTKYSDIFALLSKLQANDIVYVTVDGTQHAYRVRTIEKGSSQQIIDSGLTGDLVLTTCWPVGTAADRIAVSATRIN